MDKKVNDATPKRAKIGKALRIAGDVILVLIVAVALFAIAVSVAAKKDKDGAATIFGYQLRFVRSSSMEKSEHTDVSAYKIKSIKVKSCVFVNVVPKDEQKREKWLDSVSVGDVLTFKYVYGKQETITHRVVKKESKPSGGFLITLEGDNKTDNSVVGQQIIDTSQENSPNYIIGRVVGQSYFLGLLVYAFKSTAGIVCMIIIPCLIIIALQAMRIVKVVNADKKDKMSAKQEEQANEIEQLKRQLQQLKQAAKDNAETPQREENQE